MTTIRVGVFPGELKEVAFQPGVTVRELLDLAGINVSYEQDITLDGATVNPDTIVTFGGMLLVTKRIKAGL